MDKREKAKKYLEVEPFKNSYQIARLNEEESKVFTEENERGLGVFIEREGIITLAGEVKALEDIFSSIKDQTEQETKGYSFHAIRPEGLEATRKFVEVEDDHPTHLLVYRSDTVEEPDVEVTELLPSHAETINQYWNLGGEDSTDYIIERIEEAPAYGVVREEELAAWCLTHFLTEQVMMLGMLYVKEKWRGRGFAKALTRALCRDAEESDRTASVQIFKDNEPSISLATTLGFEIEGEHHWFHGELPSI